MGVNKTREPSDNDLWCISGTVSQGFVLYNKAAGADKVLTHAAGGAYMQDRNQDDSSLSTWKIDVSTAQKGYFCFTLKNGGSQYINHQQGILKYWGDRSNGSSCYLFEALPLLKAEIGRAHV